jgi:hypothetical protein
MAERVGLNSQLVSGRRRFESVGMPLVFNTPFPFARIASV